MFRIYSVHYALIMALDHLDGFVHQVKKVIWILQIKIAEKGVIKEIMKNTPAEIYPQLRD